MLVGKIGGQGLGGGGVPQGKFIGGGGGLPFPSPPTTLTASLLDKVVI